MFNWTQFINQPMETALKVFIDMFGNGFYLIPISVIGVALWQQKQDPFIVTIYFCTSFSLLSGATIMAGFFEIVPLYIILTAIGFTVLIVQFIFEGW